MGGDQAPSTRPPAALNHERRLGSLLEHASDAVAVVDETGAIRYMSAPIERILGWTAEEMTGRGSHEFVHPDDLERCRAIWEQVVARPGATARIDIRHRTRDGRWRLIEGHFSNRLHDPDVRGVVINERDVTARRAAEAELRARTRRDEVVNRLGRHALEGLDPSILATEASELVRPLLRGTTSIFVRVLADEDAYVVESHSGGPPVEAGPLPVSNGRSIEAEALRSGRTVTWRAWSGPARLGARTTSEHAPPSVTSVSVPVPGWHGPHGALTVHRPAEDAFAPDEIGFVRAVAGVLSLALQRRGAEAQIRDQALHDALTGLPNRALFLDRVHHAIDRAERRDGFLAVVYVDVDRFKDVNDGFGHTAGDHLLVKVAERLAGAVRAGDTVARMGGDEFTLLCEDLATHEELHEVVARVVEATSRPVHVDGTELRPTVSIGVRPSHGREDAEQLVTDADTAMYRAKQRGRSRVQHFEPELRERMRQRLQVGPDLERAMAEDELHLAFQPVVDLGSAAVVGVEALLRWHDPERGVVSPASFIPLAEESGHIHQLGRWVLARTLAQVAEAGIDPGIVVAINVSPAQLVNPTFPDVVAAALADAEVAPRQICLEVTEGAFEHDLDTMGATLRDLRALGVSTAIDDFGTGYSSIAYLKRLPVDVLKLDASFVRTLHDDREDRAIAEAVATFGRSLGLLTVAEGVETAEQAATVRALGYDRAQGFLYSRPTTLDRAVAQRPRTLRAIC